MSVMYINSARRKIGMKDMKVGTLIVKLKNLIFLQVH